MRILAFLSVLFLMAQTYAQPFQITFTGSGMSNTVSTVEVQNLTQNTVLTLNGTDILELVTNIGISDGFVTKGDLMIYPNPAASSCRIEFFNSRNGEVKIKLFDVSGKLLLQNEDHLPQGIHRYDLAGLKTGMYVVKVSTPANSNSAQIISTEMAAGQPSLKYAGITLQSIQKAKLSALTNVIQMQYNAGEMLLFKGTSGIYSRVITLLPTQNQNVDFGFIDCTDGDGNHYPVVTIGTQTWMAENLKTHYYKNSSAIPNVLDGTTWSGLSTGAMCWYNNDSATYAATYGALYNWYAVDNSSGLCPTGWHVPSDLEWQTLELSLGMSQSMLNLTGWRGTDEGGKMKEAGLAHWNSPNTGATNTSGFTALPGGFRFYTNGGFIDIGNNGYWWSSTAYSATHTWNRVLHFNNNVVNRNTNSKKNGFSVRCVMDTGISASIPTLTTDTLTSITTSTAISGGNVTSDGGASVTARGVCWSTSPNPTISNNTTSDGTGTGTFTSNITGLSPSTAYYVRAYATNSAGTAYGNQQTFTTQPVIITPPTVTTDSISGITDSAATSGGHVTSQGGASVTARGVCWSTSPNPTIANNITSDGTGTGIFTSNITGLSPSTTYYVRAYATNSGGTAYGSQQPFTTQAATVTPPTVTTDSISGITDSAATSGGHVTSQGGASVTARGVCWSTSPSPTIANDTTSNGTGTGSFTSSITGLTQSTTYYVRAYATHSGGTVYGNQVNFTTAGSTPSNYPPGYVHCDPTNPTAVVDVTNPTTGRTWMDRNLGAAQVATSSTDAASYGDLYQWGRLADGHQCRTSATTTTLSGSNVPGHGSFILAPNSPYDWRSPQNTNLWQGVNGVNNPCPTGYRLPTEVELNAERLSWSSNNTAGAFASPLKLPVAGYRHYSNGAQGLVGSGGYYWSSTVSGTYSRLLSFGSTNAGISSYYQARGYSVRCIMD
jgi:uncharacterized protein (TIGR02145 family)